MENTYGKGRTAEKYGETEFEGIESTTLEGWVCPNCRRGVAPTVQYCDCKPAQVIKFVPYEPYAYPNVYPTYPGPFYPTWTYTTDNIRLK